jgi:DNA-binding MarR family transcriptional regulator
MRQLAKVTNLPVKYVRHTLNALSKKNIVERVPHTFSWSVNSEVAQGYGRKEIPMIEKLKHFLARQEEAISTTEIARRVGANRKIISQYLWKLHDKGLVERVPMLHNNKPLWKPTDALKKKLGIHCER